MRRRTYKIGPLRHVVRTLRLRGEMGTAVFMRSLECGHAVITVGMRRQKAAEHRAHCPRCKS